MNSKGLRISLKALVIIVAAIYANSAAAISLEFVPSAQTVQLGAAANVDVVVVDPGGSSVGAYDFFVDFDPSILTFDSLVFGPALGGPADSLQAAVESPAGRINAAEVSLLLDLTPLQDGVANVTLFSLTFETVGLGTSSLSLADNIAGIPGAFLGDELGLPIVLESVGMGEITVVPPSVTEPATLLLFPLVLAGVILRARARRAASRGTRSDQVSRSALPT